MHLDPNYSPTTAERCLDKKRTVGGFTSWMRFLIAYFEVTMSFCKIFRFFRLDIMHARFLSIFGWISALVGLIFFFFHLSDASWNTCTLSLEYCTQLYPRELPAFKEMAEAYARDREKFSDLFQRIEWIRRVRHRRFRCQSEKLQKIMCKCLLTFVHTFDALGADYVCFLFSSGCFQALFKTLYNLFSLRTLAGCMKSIM